MQQSDTTEFFRILAHLKQLAVGYLEMPAAFEDQRTKEHCGKLLDEFFRLGYTFNLDDAELTKIILREPLKKVAS